MDKKILSVSEIEQALKKLRNVFSIEQKYNQGNINSNNGVFNIQEQEEILYCPENQNSFISPSPQKSPFYKKDVQDYSMNLELENSINKHEQPIQAQHPIFAIEKIIRLKIKKRKLIQSTSMLIIQIKK
ncbi:hypothetical protein PPERSA_04156 [Pseudocohnilembus persalinus]|uniref:Uncharacterized protein n=1 Tax=Pseudocohnilembus persalinus TaxID=266149 RepID=A0A0V0QN00_PSEPJ|nr:hypothetical protein PPERSA_04156 [Pseudocohnilembus persalinus]|eukprot:KRX03604.1 hypothetical protein PPERSA_04156 [Pseudocohnilembus persalinus]